MLCWTVFTALRYTPLVRIRQAVSDNFCDFLTPTTRQTSVRHTESWESRWDFSVLFSHNVLLTKAFVVKHCERFCVYCYCHLIHCISPLFLTTGFSSCHVCSRSQTFLLLDMVTWHMVCVLKINTVPVFQHTHRYLILICTVCLCHRG